MSTRTRPSVVAVVALAFTMTAGALAPPVAAAGTGDIVAQIDRERYFAVMRDELYTHPGDDRGFGPEHDLARQNILERFVGYGLDARLDPFEAWGETWYSVVAVQPGAVRPDRIWIVCSHYDSVDNPGADDNASGVAGVLEIARVLSGYTFEDTIVYIAFDREEQGLIGSQAYAEAHANDDIRGVVAMDMIAYDVGAETVIFRSRSADLKAALAGAVAAYGDGLATRDDGVGDYSNHAPFEWKGFEAGQAREEYGNPHYHTPNDHIEMPDYLDFDFAIRIVRSVGGWLVDHAVLVGACPEDLDGSGAVDFGDVLAVLSAWGGIGGPEDLDGSGVVDFGDLLVVLGAWGPCR